MHWSQEGGGLCLCLDVVFDTMVITECLMPFGIVTQHIIRADVFVESNVETGRPRQASLCKMNRYIKLTAGFLRRMSQA